MWDWIMKIGGISGLISLLVSLSGGLYLFFENKRFKKLEAEKEYEISIVELEELKFKENQERSSISSYNILHDIMVDNKYKILEKKSEAKIKYYEELKNHSPLWFLKNKR